jgi:N-alpha-acetyltransferase 40
VISSGLNPETSTAQDPATNGVNKRAIYTLDVHSPQSIPESDLESCFNLIKQTSLSDYESSSSGWSERRKRNEMRLPDMRYLLVRGPTDSGEQTSVPMEAKRNSRHHPECPSTVLGFLAFMVTYEAGKEVIYCYEIHLSPDMQGKGLGKHLLTLLECIGRNVGLEKAMLTVFISNAQARGFYQRLGYEADEVSPKSRRLRSGMTKEQDYQILSKVL